MSKVAHTDYQNCGSACPRHACTWAMQGPCQWQLCTSYEQCISVLAVLLLVNMEEQI